MDLNVKPTKENIEQLKGYINKLPANSPYLWLVKYEQQLVDNNKNVRALARICNSDQHTVINKIEGLSKENWFRVSNLTNLDEIPNNYFDIVLWSDCDIESELRQALAIYPKLKIGGRVYFDNLVDSFERVLKKCLNKKDLKALLGNDINIGHVAQVILEHIFNNVNEDYTVKLLQTVEPTPKQYIVLTKGTVTFKPSTELQSELEHIDKIIAEKFTPEKTLQLSTSELEKIRNRVFELVSKAIEENTPIKKKLVCEQLVKEKLLPDCKLSGKHGQFLTKQHIDDIRDSIENVTVQIDNHIAMNVLSVPTIIDLLKEIPNPDVADEQHWEAVIRKTAAEHIARVEEAKEAKAVAEDTKVDVNSYWSNTGQYQKEYDNLYDQLVPTDGPADSDDGNLLRIASMAYYDFNNNGVSFEDFLASAVDELETLDQDDLEFFEDLNPITEPEWEEMMDTVVTEIMDRGDYVYSDDEEIEIYPDLPAPKKLLPAVLLPGLVNIGGFSCFMDSVLFSILLPKDGYFQKQIIDKKLTTNNATSCDYFSNKKDRLSYLENFQDELRKLTNIMRGTQEPSLTCYPIVQQMQQCNALTKALMSGDQQDDSEFLRALMEMFDLAPTTVTITRSVSNDNKEWLQTSTQTEPQAILEVAIPENSTEIPELVSWYQRIQTSNYSNLPIESWHMGPDPQNPAKDKPYKYSREKTTIDSSKALIFHIARRQIKNWVGGNPVYIKNTRPIVFREYIEEKPNKHYGLQVVTVLSGSAYGGHYTAYFKYGPQWFHYDDTAIDDQRVRPANWEEVVNVGSRNGSLYMYYPLEN